MLHPEYNIRKKGLTIGFVSDARNTYIRIIKDNTEVSVNAGLIIANLSNNKFLDQSKVQANEHLVKLIHDVASPSMSRLIVPTHLGAIEIPQPFFKQIKDNYFQLERELVGIRSTSNWIELKQEDHSKLLQVQHEREIELPKSRTEMSQKEKRGIGNLFSKISRLLP